MLRQYQQEARLKINQLLNAGRHPVYSSSTGTGKTKTAIEIIKDRIKLNQRIFVLTPQEEIFYQWEIECVNNMIDYGLINSYGVVGKNKSIYICMPLSLNNLLSLLPEKFGPDLIITDECFIKGTKIATNYGQIPIEKLKPYHLIYTYNEEKNRIELNQIQELIIRKKEKQILKLKFSNGKKIKCTYDHLFFTNKGWKKAIEIEKSVDMVRLINNDYIKEVNHALSYMRERNNKSSQKTKRSMESKQKNLLFTTMFFNLLQTNFFKNYVRNKQKICKRKNEKKQSNVQKRNSRESQSNIKTNGTQTKNSRWQWKTKIETANIISRKIKLVYGICCKNIKKTWKWLSSTLQNRYCKSKIKNSNRNRWKFSLPFRKTKTRQEKREIIKWIRLESIEIQKQRNFKRFKFLSKYNQVYDLSIFNNHNYFANGILVHNCHHSMANTWQNIYNYYPKAQRLGLTATPQRYDGKGLDNYYTDIVQTITMKEAIDAGYLAEPLGVVPEEYHLNVRMQNGDFDPEEQAEQLGKVQIIGNVIEHYSNIFCGLPILVACCTYQHAEMMTKSFNEAGWKFGHIHSELNKHERKSMLKKIRNGKLNGLCTVAIGIEGMDIPGLYGLIWLRRTMSITIYLQFIGRVLRPMKGKKYGIIIDPVGNYFIHGRPEMDRKWTLAGRDEQQEPEILVPEMKLCPQCGVMNAKVNQLCHICGFDFINDIKEAMRKRKLPVMIDGKLIVLDGEGLAARKKEIRENLKEQRKQKSEQKEETQPRIISRQEKVQLLKDGLSGKKDLFSQAVKEWL